ncbi:cryptochrome FAD-binding-containing protein [Coleophoma cylindrospora]|uniref:Cryptochrome FAD-binding-containing protein n=1 Tax=Coleophoma cylindrospora TaxID=1849047 RepID=A0A3D8RB96_9HELO|nr:cryptochrome FAD-binding-containing protein [Coleophoma cylindrospora]
MAKPRVIYWFRTDLRLHDSPALKAALDLHPEAFWPIWTWDPHYVYRARVGPNRWQFLLDSQRDLSESLTKLNQKSKLFLIRESPQTLLPKLFKAWKVTHLVFEKDTDAYARDRDAEIMRAAKAAGVEVVIRSGRTLWDSDLLVEQHHGKATMSISQVQAAGPKVGAIPRPLAAPTKIPDPGEMPLEFEQDVPEQAPDLNAQAREHGDRSYAQLAGPHGDFAVPSMEELGFTATSLHRGGETIARKLLDDVIANEEYTALFEKPKTAPTDFEPQATTLLSPHLHFGTLSVREFYWRVQDVVDNYRGKGKASQPPVSLTGQLLFRDMYFGAQAALGHAFGQTMYNSHCRFIPWHLPSKVDHERKQVTGEYHIDSDEAHVWFQRWKWGRTGFPWIDALMRQLRQEGWIHHLGRHAVACFLTRGGCYVSWERGAEVFEEWLIDHETACNAGNWQWLSCTAFFAQFYRCYSPVAFPQKWDKDGVFVRRYVPELAALDSKYIYEPWKAPIQDQRKAGVRISGAGEKEEEGVYPKPMFDFAERRAICLDGMKKAYHVGLYGDDPKVVDGSWRQLFDDAAEGPTEGKTFEDAMGEGGAMTVKKGPAGRDSNGDAVEETAGRTKGKGGETKTSDRRTTAVTKRKAAQGTLDGHVKKMKK